MNEKKLPMSITKPPAPERTLSRQETHDLGQIIKERTKVPEANKMTRALRELLMRMVAEPGARQP